MQKRFTIGVLAKSLDINVETIRFYERCGLIDRPQKPVAGYRVYPRETRDRLTFIRRAKTLGFTLSEIEHLLALGDQSCTDVQALASQKLDQVHTRMADLARLERALSELLTECRSTPDYNACPIIEVLLSDQ